MGNANTTQGFENMPKASSHSRGNVSPSSLQPIVFHQVHGENIRLSKEGSVASRTESFCRGIVFSSRPIQLNERVILKFLEVSTSWSGALRFGFTAHDPNTFRGGLPKYACPDLTNKAGNWAKALGERYATQGTLLFYYVTEAGDVYFGINGEEKGIFFGNVNTTSPLWALVDIYGNTASIELVDQLKQLNNHSEILRNAVTTETVSEGIGRLNLNTPEIEPENEVPLNIYNGIHFTVLPFHKTKGYNAQLSLHNMTVAERSNLNLSSAYVFTSRPVQRDERLVLQIMHKDSAYSGGLGFGLTTCDPSSLMASSLPDDADMLLDRPEYWVVKKNVAAIPNIGDELTFLICPDGQVKFARNDETLKTVMYVDSTQQYWAFFDIYGSTTKVKLLGTTHSAPHCTQLIAESAAAASVNEGLTVSLPPQDESGSFTSSLREEQTNNECRICFEHPVESALYPCGHMCMCYDCAQELFRGRGGGLCPVCRSDIRDVLRIFKA